MNSRAIARSERVMSCIEHSLAEFSLSSDDQSQRMAANIDDIRTTIEADKGSQNLSQHIKCVHMVLPGELFAFPQDPSHPIWDASRKSLAFFYEQFPDYLKKREAAYERVLKRGSIRSEYEYRVVADEIYRLEGEEPDGDLIIKLQTMSDDAEF